MEFMSKSGFVCEDGRRKNVRKPRSGFTQDVFSAEVWLASAPLHEAGKTTRSGNTLKTGIGRGQLSFASDNPSSNPNACPLISTFSKPHSEVASVSRTHDLKGFRKGASLFSGLLKSEGAPANAGFQKRNERGTSPTKGNPAPASRILQQERRSSLRQIERLSLSRKSTAFSAREQFPFCR